MSKVQLFGASYSVYTRIIRLVLEDCAVPYDFAELDIFAKDDLPPDYLQRHPFSKIPALQHGDLQLFETDAIAQYLIAAFDRRDLLPEDTSRRARCLQLMRIADNYVYPRLVWGVFVEEQNRKTKLQGDELLEAHHVLRVLERFVESPYFLGRNLTLADVWVQPMIACLKHAPSGSELMADCPGLSAWFELMAQQPAVLATRFPLELEG